METRQKIVDTNEPGEIRQKLLEVGWEQKKLHTADYWFFSHDFKKVGIERKEVNDLLSSTGDKLSRQLENMLDHYNINILIIEGSLRRIGPTDRIVTGRGIEHYTWDLVFDYLRRWQDKGVTIEITTNMGHTIHRLNRLYAFYQKPYSMSARSKEYTDDRVLAFPSGCRGKTGMKCLGNRSLREVACMSVEQLVSIDGIGSKKAELIFNHFNKE